MRKNRIASNVARKFLAVSDCRAAFPLRLTEKAPEFDSVFADFLSYCQKMQEDHIRENAPVLIGEHIEAVEGGRYMKLVKVGPHSRSAFLFVDKTNGDILKTATWSAPAKTARGNIFDRASWKNVSPYGAAYLR